MYMTLTDVTIATYPQIGGCCSSENWVAIAIIPDASAKKYSFWFNFFDRGPKLIWNPKHMNKLCNHTKFGIPNPTVHSKFSYKVIITKSWSHFLTSKLHNFHRRAKNASGSFGSQTKIVLDQTQYSGVNCTVKFHSSMFTKNID